MTIQAGGMFSGVNLKISTKTRNKIMFAQFPPWILFLFQNSSYFGQNSCLKAK